SIRRVAYPMITAKGIGLSPDGERLYVAETQTGRLWAFDLAGPGEIRREAWPSPNGGRCLASVPGYQNFDSLAVDGDGNICVATLLSGYNPTISNDDAYLGHTLFPDHHSSHTVFRRKHHNTA